MQGAPVHLSHEVAPRTVAGIPREQTGWAFTSEYCSGAADPEEFVKVRVKLRIVTVIP
jgi:hypothetical protein